MTDDGKKVSFGFSKSIKKSALKIQPPKEEKKVDYIECVDEKCIKVVGEEKKEDAPLVIPLLGSKTWHDRILNKTDADIFEPKVTEVKKEQNENVNGATVNAMLPMDVSQIKKEEPDNPNAIKSLDEQAASEIIASLNGTDVKLEDPTFRVPAMENGTLRGREESTLEDYEQIPIDAFGLAMLRGMGWKPEDGIGKNAKRVTTSLPELRPRGMGLGADKAALPKPQTTRNGKHEEQLKLQKGSFVKIIAGKRTNNYGRVEGFDDEAGRLIVKMALTGESQSLNEYLVVPVTKAEYAKNSKVLNAAKYEEYRVTSKEIDAVDENSPGPDAETSKVVRKMEKRLRRESRGGDSSASEGDESRERAKKSKRRDSSRTRKKNKKREKERDKTRGRRNERDLSKDRRRSKKHKRSRTRSPKRR